MCPSGLKSASFEKFPALRRNRVVAASTPWVTTAEAMGSKAAALHRAVGFERFEGVFAAGGGKAAAEARGAENGDQDGGDEGAIHTHQKDQNVSSRIHTVSVNSLAR